MLCNYKSIKRKRKLGHKHPAMCSFWILWILASEKLHLSKHHCVHGLIPKLPHLTLCLGVTLERLNEGLSPRHCALSLVGEPIMYPEINALVDELHKRRISTFLVTNAQFPEKIKSLKPITQVLHHLEILK